jgi:hypothetical protein
MQHPEHVRIMSVLERIKYRDWKAVTSPAGYGGMFFEWLFMADGNAQRSRKWYLSQHATDSEVVQTALMAALAAEEHEVREHFLFNGCAIFGPHHNVYALFNIKQDVRPEPATHYHEGPQIV